MIDPLVTTSISAAIGALFVVAGVHKLRDVAAFRATLAAYRILPAAALTTAAMAIPLIEAGVGALAVAAPIAGPIGTLACAILLVLYAAVIGLSLLRGNSRIDCGCVAFVERRELTGTLVWRNLALVVLAGIALLPVGARGMTALDWIGVPFAVAIAAMLYAIYEGLAAFPRRGDPR